MKLYNLYAYAFLKTPIESLVFPVGMANPLLLITGGDLSAVVEPEVCLDTLQNDDERLIQSVLCHDRVICELFQQTTILPLRFGTSFLEAENLLTYLCSHAQEYQEKIEQLEGKGEYFLAKKQHYEAQQDFYTLQGSEWQNLVHLVSQSYSSTRIITAPGTESRIYLLVDFQEEPLLIEQVLRWQKACPRWELQLGQVSPPYHFT